jgi:hypothetical protein
LSKLDVHHRSLERGTGDELIATARILPSYLPSGGFDQVDARVEVEYPKVGLGTLLTNQRDRRKREVRGEELDARTDALTKITVPTGKAIFPLYDDGTHGDLHPGNYYWTGTLHGLGATDGAYSLRYMFDFTKSGCTTHREIRTNVYVDVRVDPKASSSQVISQLKNADGGYRTSIRLMPADRYGNLWGAGRLDHVDCLPQKLCTVAKDDIVDNGDGSYTVTVSTSPNLAGVRLLPAGASFDFPLPCERCPTVKQIELTKPKVNEHSFTNGTVRLSGPAPPGGAEIYLTSSNTGAATVRHTVIVNEGEKEAPFEIAAHYAHSGPALSTISARYGDAESAATLIVLPLLKKGGKPIEPPSKPVHQHDPDDT